MLDLCCKCEIRQSLIFQCVGNYCLECWQERTEPQVGRRNGCSNVRTPAGNKASDIDDINTNDEFCDFGQKVGESI